jgi:glyoxylase-like metal-dependent hydrolase (beta-lactamase superfamily II)
MADPVSMTAPVPLDRRLVAARARRPEEARADLLAEGFWGLRLPLPYPVTRAVNCFLLQDPDGGWTLVDCGSGIGAGWPALLYALSLAGVAPSRVTTLVLTHLHPDHASLSHQVVQRLGCRLLRHAGPGSRMDRIRDPRRTLDDRFALAYAEGVPEADLADIVDAPPAGDGQQPRPVPDELLVEGDVLPTRAGGWYVVPTPGHSPQQMALFEPNRRWLIAADGVYPVIRPFLEWGNTPDPLAEYRASLARLEALAPRLLLPGHGRPDRRPQQRIASARGAVDAVVARVESALGEAPRTAYDVTCALVGDDPDPDERGSWLSVALCVLEHLTRRGDAISEIGSDGRRRFAWA